jgi:hypothetical protein
MNTSKCSYYWVNRICNFLTIVGNEGVLYFPVDNNHILKYYLHQSVHVLPKQVPLLSSGQSSWLQIQRSRVRFPALPDVLRNIASGTGLTQPCEYN